MSAIDTWPAKSAKDTSELMSFLAYGVQVRSMNDYLDRGLGRVATHPHIHDVVALDRRLPEIPFRSRSSVIIASSRAFPRLPEFKL